MFEWLPKYQYLSDIIIFPGPNASPPGGDLLGQKSRIARKDWRSMGRFHHYTIGVGTLILFQPAISIISILIRDKAWDTVPFKFKPDVLGTRTLDEKLVSAIHKFGWQAPKTLSPGGIPWELAMIPNLAAQEAAVRAWAAASV